ncbi:hypothetical protein Tco_0431733 [Tanacetum coccineum]
MTTSIVTSSTDSQMQQIEDKAKESCMVSCRQPHSHLKLLLNYDLKGTRTESGFKRAFATLFGQDIKTFTGTMFLNVDQLEKQLDKEEFQEIGSMASFKVLESQFQMFIKSRIYLDGEYVVMTRNYFLQYTQLEIPEFCDTLIQHMESVKKSIDKRALHKREYDNWVNERQMQTIEEKVDTSKALDANNADIRPIYDEEPMAEVQPTAEINISATGQQHTEQPEFNNEGEVDQNAEQCHDTLKSIEAKVKHDIDVIETINIELEHKVAKLLKENKTLKRHYKELFDSIKTTRAKTIEHTTSLIAKNDEFKAQLQEKGFAIAALKNELRKLTGNSVNTKFAKSSILGKPVLQPHRNQSVVRQPTAFKSERPRISKPRFASQVDVNNDLSKPVTTHYLPKERESAVVKPHHVIASSESRNSSKNMPRFSSNDMVHNHYLEEAKKKTQERGRNSRPSVMPSARSQSTANGSKPKPRINNQKSRNWPASKSSCKKHAQSHKTTKTYIPVEKKSDSKNHGRQIPIGKRFSLNKSSNVYLKTMPPRSGLTWKPTDRIFTQVGLKWIPIRKSVKTRYNTNDSALPLGKETNNPKTVICANSSSLSAGHKGKAPTKGSKTGKSASAKEPVEEPITEVIMDDAGDDVARNDNLPQDTSKPKTRKTLNLEWFNQPLRPPTPDPEWNKHQPLLLTSPNKLDWNNPEGDCYPFDLSKPLHLQGPPGHQTVVVDYFFNNDLEYLKTSNVRIKNMVSIWKLH